MAVSDKMVEVRVTHPNIQITRGEKGDKTESPAVGDVIKVRESQLAGGLKGKVRLLADEAKGAGLTLENAKAALEASGYTVTKARTPKAPKGGEAAG